MHPSGAGEEMQSTFNGYTKRHLGLYHWQESDRHECWVRIGEPPFRCRFHMCFVKYCSSSSRFWKRHADKPRAAQRKSLCFGAIAMDSASHQRSPGQDIAQVILRAAKQGSLSE